MFLRRTFYPLRQQSVSTQIVSWSKNLSLIISNTRKSTLNIYTGTDFTFLPSRWGKLCIQTEVNSHSHSSSPPAHQPPLHLCLWIKYPWCLDPTTIGQLCLDNSPCPQLYSLYLHQTPSKKQMKRGRRQDGGGIGRGDHFLSYKFIKRTIERWTKFTKQLLIASSGHRAPRKAAHCLRREVGQNIKDKKGDKELGKETRPGKES